MKIDEKFMKAALKEAQKASEKGEVPIGCVIVKDGKIITRAHNIKEGKNDATMHAELIAIQKASKKVGWRLSGCDMYVTLEPCSMCAGAIIQSRIGHLIFGARDEKGGAVGSKLDLIRDYKFNHETKVTESVLKEECSKILKDFFKALRRK